MTAFFGFPRDGHAYSADEVGAALAGLIRRDSNGLPVPGVLGPLSVTAVPTAWKVEVPSFTFVVRSGSGIQLSGLSAAEQHDITPATGIPAGQGRVDVVAWDALNDVIVVITGTVSASPAVPNTAGYEPLAEVRVNSGDGAVVQSQITPVFERTGLAGERKAQGVVAKRNVEPGATTSVNVAFPEGMFAVPPVVHVSKWGSAARDVTVGYDNVTAAGFTIYLGSASSMRRSVGASWSASEG